MSIDVEFDTNKETANLAKHRISLAKAAALLAGPHDAATDDRTEYGEERTIAVGEIAGRLYVCVYTLRGTTYRIISLRKANRRESNAYRKSEPG
jgi:uncharacterized DUF497 family protein